MFKTCLTLFLLSLAHASACAQADLYPGTWQMEYLETSVADPVQVKLQIATPERGVLFPAQLTLQCDTIIAVYQLLLARRNNFELALSKNKFPRTGTAADLKKQAFFLNGLFEFGKDNKGLSQLTLKRLQPGALNGQTDLISPGKELPPAVLRLARFLQNAAITLTRSSGPSWQSADCARLLSPVLSPVYLGVLDTFHVQNRYANIDLSGSKKANTDLVSVNLNGHIIFDQVPLNKKKRADEIMLDTGVNILIIFADNFGSGQPNLGKLKLQSDGEQLLMDFASRPDSAAGFIVARLYCGKDRSNDVSFQNAYVPGEEKNLKADERLIGSIVSTSREITLAIWDDAAEDGDSISINIGGKKLVHGFPVKKNPQFITVTLQPGPNTIDFMADNLGSIPPNTSVLEIIDGKKRRSFFMATNLGENNLIKIFYDITGTPKRD